ncbi:tubulin-specific chaperone D [Trichonephila clavata]|uniref:Tubulin-specific chaperone D n=1 Tax=Trichonephila clavata TaxID=2740835 RepID=A0A8X6M1Y1_TRICU|nr:tubulin-specific chaperone D [Trichonephila clavata]
MDTSRSRTYSEGNADDTDSIGLGCALEVFKEYDEIISLISQLKTVYHDQSLSEKVIERFMYILNQYQEQPHLLDRYLDDFINELLKIARNAESDKNLQYLAFKFLYIITKVRGYKVVLRHLPHEVSDVEPVLSLLNEQDPRDATTWEARYMLLLWMSIIVMIPFHMHRLDDTTDNKSEKKPIMERIIDVIKLYLSVSDKARDAAAFLAAHFITRPDVKDVYLKEYLDWCLKMLISSNNEISLQAGILSSLALLFKHGKRDDMKDYGASILRKILECGFKDSGSSVVRKMALKLIQRIGLSFLRVKIASWRYSRGKRSLADNLAYGDVGKQIPQHEESSDDEEYDIPDDTEDIIEQLLVGLRDKDTIIRWSAAKGIGRVTGRLPKELADDVVTSVLELFSLRESDSAWHGGCLALAELGRRGLILPQHLDKVVNVVLKALIYDEQRGNFSVGAHIRDAACYVCWSFARAYDPTVLQPYVNSIAGALLVTTVFDREITCRRAASAAFQENVGRQGTFPHGIEILTETDYYAVGSRHNSFLNLSVHIAQFPEYTLTLINHLLEHKVNHWDSSVRELASKALHNLTVLDSSFMAKTAIPDLLIKALGIDLNARHGSIFSIGEIVHALSIQKDNSEKIEDILGMEIVEKIRTLIFLLDQRGLFRGLGGILMRNAVCLLIEKMSIAALPFHKDKELLEKWQEMLDSCFQHQDASVRSSAISALPHFLRQYHPSESPQCSKLVKHYLEQLTSNHMETRCGFALAIGAFPKFILNGHVAYTLQGLSKCAELTEEHSCWAEARRDAIKALSQIAVTVRIDSAGNENDSICQSNLDILFNSFLAGTNDYTLDSRGEIGAIVREAAMLAIQETVILVMTTEPKMLSEDLVSKIFGVILQQCTEKIDRTRAIAGSVFECLLFSEPKVPHIPYHAELLEVFNSDVCDEINWASPGDTFQQFVKILCFQCYRNSLLLGFVVSVGGLTESLVKYSSSALVSYLLENQSNEELMKAIADDLISILKENQQNDRIVIPFFKMMNYLLLSNIIFLNGDQQSDFYDQLLNLTWVCSYKSRDPQKIIAAVDLFCNLLQLYKVYHRHLLSKLVIFLCHRFPRIRKVTANKLYEAFITYDVVEEEVVDEVTELLCETDWNQALEVLRPIRNTLCEKLGLEPPKLKAK